MSSINYADLAARVTTSGEDHPIWVGWGILNEIGERVRNLLPSAVAYVISDEKVQIHASVVQKSMEHAGIPTHTFLIPSGETSKNLDTVQNVYSWLADKRAERGHLILAVGGGVVGDLAGFVAATYLRGIPFAQVPTTLLGMMDASIGGKVAVDLPQGKNLVGAFYQPKFVLSDVETLRTLPERELSSGWAEAIKHGLILDEELLQTFENRKHQIRKLDPDIATRIIRKSVAIKANIVSQDEKELLGIRILLNYGHTIGHAIESITSYTKYLHGEAVSIGMMGAAQIGRSLGMLDDNDVNRQEEVLKAYGLPVFAQGLSLSSVLEAMRSDKKTSDGTIRWVLLNGIGNAVTSADVSEQNVRQALASVLRTTGSDSIVGAG